MDSALADRRVLVGIDFSGASERALLSAVALAERERRELELVHVFEWDGPGLGEGALRVDAADASGPVKGEVRSLVRAARGRLAELCSSLVGDRVPATIRVLVGDPASELCRAAEQSRAALLVLGTAGRRGLAGESAGRTASRTCTSSPIPVLLVAQNPSTGESQLLLRS